MSRIIFITGTDTGVGKTVLTTILLAHLRESGVRALAMKPFCCGGIEDMESFRRIQGNELTPTLLNPVYLKESLAPLAATRTRGGTFPISKAQEAIRTAGNMCDCLLVEGVGGVLVPLAPKVLMADFMASVNCDIVLVARNELGTLNHTLLSVEALQSRGMKRVKIILMGQKQNDHSVKTNMTVLKKCTENMEIFSVPFFTAIERSSRLNFSMAKKNKKTLARILHADTFAAR